MTDRSDMQWNQDEIARHLRSAMDTLTPDVLDRIDLSTPQEIYVRPSRRVRLYRRFRTAAVAAAACLCMAALAGGVALYQNSRVESIVGLDVNPSLELSVNRNEKVLQAKALNEDAEGILDGMDLKNVDLDIAVNALIGSMVRGGYLNELDNAILVTVANDDEEKASALRQDVVVDIETSLEEHEVTAVVYDQQAPVSDEVEELAKEYGISYGKAYFLQELIRENNLSGDEMEAFARMTMEEIAREIAERSYSVSVKENGAQKPPASSQTEGSTAKTAPETQTQESVSSSAAETAVPDTPPETGAPQTTAEATQESTESAASSRARIDYVDYMDGVLNVYFRDRVKWRNPSVSVSDGDGQRYAAVISDTGSESCEIQVTGLPGGSECTFSLAGVAPREDGASYGTVNGYFETPDIAPELTEDPEEEEPETAAPETTEAASEAVETKEPATAAPTETPTAPEQTAAPTAPAETEAESAAAAEPEPLSETAGAPPVLPPPERHHGERRPPE